jgi:hypothetical protein
MRVPMRMLIARCLLSYNRVIGFVGCGINFGPVLRDFAFLCKEG